MSSGGQSQTPKKRYISSGSVNTSACRLCGSVKDASHCKNLFAKANRALLTAAEDIYGESLPCHELFPHLLCRSCERRLNNVTAFKNVILQSQRSLAKSERVKRCIEVSPSASRTLKSSKEERAHGKSSRRGLSFSETQTEQSIAESTEKEIQHASQPQSALDILHTATEVCDERGRQDKDPRPSEEQMLEKVLVKLDMELREVAQRSTNSVLRDRGYPGLSTFTFEEILKEMQSLCPTVFRILSNMLQLDLNPEKNSAPLALVYGIVMFKRFHELSRIQRLNTVLLADGNASKELMERLNKYGFSLSPTMKYNIQEDIGKHFLDHAVNELKKGKKFVFVLDNIDWDVKVHDMRSDKQNTSVHAVATSIVFDRVSSEHLPDNGPQKSLAACEMRDVLKVTDDETRSTRERYKIFLGKILCEEFAAFEFLKGVVPARTPCQYQQEMGTESVVVPLPVLMKDEKKYAEVIDVLDQLEIWTHDLHSQAGLCPPPEQDHVPPGPPIAAPSRPDQPASHVPPTPQPDDPLANVKVPCFGDQLTRVRLAGAKDLRAGCHTPQDRLDHLYPYRIVDWHTKRSFLKVIFKRLYKNSGRERGTLRYFREKLHRRNVTVDVKHFEDCEQLFLSVGRCYTVEALLQFFGMESTDSRITKNRPPYHILDVGDTKQQYYDTALDRFLDEHLMSDDQEESSSSQPAQDYIKNYSLCLLKYYFVFVDLKDAVKEGNGERLGTLHKILLEHFKSLKGFNPYAIEMLINVIQNEVFLSEAEAHQCKWASTANWIGSPSKNIEIDLLQEIRNKAIKKQMYTMGANKTDKAIQNASRASGGQQKIAENFDAQVHRVKPTGSHTHRSAAADERIVMQDLHVLKPFVTEPNRMFNSFPDIQADPLSTMDQEEYDTWLARHKKNLLLDAPLDDSDNED